MKNPRRLRQTASGTLLVATAILFTWYLTRHPQYLTKLGQINPLSVLAIIAINSLLIAVLAGVYYYTVQLAGKKLERRENFLLTIYSSIANFFGPLQSGPGVRAVYLRQKHGVRLRDYTFATLIYYAIFAVISAIFLLIGTRPWWQTVLATLAAGGFSWFVLRMFRNRRVSPQETTKTRMHLNKKIVALLFLLAFLQVSLVAVRYYTELRATGAHVSVGQAVSYAGAANFALFVSITPDGVGIREAFLLFTQQLHGVKTGEIVSANLLDRASYILFLALLFLVALSLHAKEKITGSKSRPAA